LPEWQPLSKKRTSVRFFLFGFYQQPVNADFTLAFAVLGATPLELGQIPRASGTVSR
jgi:hypothetical protein